MALIYLGNQGVIYYSTSGGELAPGSGELYPTQAEYEAWLVANLDNKGENVMDVELNLESELAETTTRLEARAGFTTEVAVVRSGKVNFDIRWEGNDPFQSALLDAWTTRQGISMALMNQEVDNGSGALIAGCTGLVAHFSVSMSKSEALKDIQKASFNLSAMLYPYWLVTGA